VSAAQNHNDAQRREYGDTMINIIRKKRDGGKLSRQDIERFVAGIVDGTIPDYQASALLMAIYFSGLDKEEAFLLTDAMKRSGDVADLSAINGIKVDKHSTGGVGDSTTMVVGPLCAANGVPVAKMSGRGLGFTGGTIDKLESIPGFKTTLSSEEFKNIVNTVGLSVIGQSEHIAAADKKLYALRDVTATIENIGLITSSIMSKKLASGSDAIVLDVKFGSGAFMKTKEDARELAEWMVEIGKMSGKKTAAFITDMTEPLGNNVGNTLEVIGAIEVLKGKGAERLRELSINLAGYMIFAGGKASDFEEGKAMAKKSIEDGSGLAKFREFVAAQGGNPEVTEDYSLFPQAKQNRELSIKKAGYVTSINAEEVGRAAQLAGAGRAKKEDSIDPAAGIVLHKKVGDYVESGEPLATIYADTDLQMSQALIAMMGAFNIEEAAPEETALVLDVIGE